MGMFLLPQNWFLSNGYFLKIVNNFYFLFLNQLYLLEFSMYVYSETTFLGVLFSVDHDTATHFLQNSIFPSHATVSCAKKRNGFNWTMGYGLNRTGKVLCLIMSMAALKIMTGLISGKSLQIDIEISFSQVFGICIELYIYDIQVIEFHYKFWPQNMFIRAYLYSHKTWANGMNSCDKWYLLHHTEGWGL